MMGMYIETTITDYITEGMLGQFTSDVRIIREKYRGMGKTSALIAELHKHLHLNPQKLFPTLGDDRGVICVCFKDNYSIRNFRSLEQRYLSAINQDNNFPAWEVILVNLSNFSEVQEQILSKNIMFNFIDHEVVELIIEDTIQSPLFESESVTHIRQSLNLLNARCQFRTNKGENDGEDN